MIQAGTIKVYQGGSPSTHPVQFQVAFESEPEVYVFPGNDAAGPPYPHYHLQTMSVNAKGFSLVISSSMGPVSDFEVRYIAFSKNTSTFMGPVAPDNAATLSYKDTLDRVIKERFSNFHWNQGNGEQYGFGYREALVSINVWAGVLRVDTSKLVGLPPYRILGSGETFTFAGVNDPDLHPVFSLGFLALSDKVHGCWSIKGVEVIRPLDQTENP